MLLWMIPAMVGLLAILFNSSIKHNFLKSSESIVLYHQILENSQLPIFEVYVGLF